MKNFVIKIILFFVYKGIKVLNGRDSIITNELNNLPNGYAIKISTDLYNEKYIAFKILNGKIVRIKNNQNFDLHIVFKNKNLSYKTLTGKISIADAFSEHYFQMYGNIYLAMNVTRILERVEGYLFPKSICKKCLKRPFKREMSILKTYFLCIF